MDQSELGEMSNDGFYYEAASILESVRNGKGRIKSLCYNCRHRNKVGIFAIVTECCKSIISVDLLFYLITDII